MVPARSQGKFPFKISRFFILCYIIGNISVNCTKRGPRRGEYEKGISIKKRQVKNLQ